jgi:transcriptional regulator with XRE-family HTH domain
MARSSSPAIGPVLRAFRLRRERSQEEMAAKTGLHRNYIGGSSAARRARPMRSVERIPAILGVSWAELGAALDAEGKG